MPMMDYTVSFHDFAGHVFSTTSLDAANDAQAISIARRIYQSGIGQGYEIRCQDRHVHTERLTAPNFSLTNRSGQLAPV
jgi:hypothetical protein